MRRLYCLLACGFTSLLPGLDPHPVAADQATVADLDPTDTLGRTQAPVTQRLHLTPDQLVAARQGRLGWHMSSSETSSEAVVPVQWQALESGGAVRATWLMPEGAAQAKQLHWRQVGAAFAPVLQAKVDPVSGQVDLTEQGRPVLRYNYKSVEPAPVLAQVAEGNRIYARARSDYLHPLYGLAGEVLTRDWSLDHPHHRGIYWAWPEVDFGQERGDLHALQRVFARPTGRLELESGPVYAEVRAENLWQWEDRRPIVREWTTIRAYRATARGRVVDLRFQFVALEEGVSLARRDTRHYGGLNLRLATPRSQQIKVHTDPPGASPRRAWSDLSGLFAGTTASGLTVFQQAGNPEYPGDWVQYPDLSWVQPTFPTAGTRYALSREHPLILRFRLWIHVGGLADETWIAQLWDACHSPLSPSLD